MIEFRENGPELIVDGNQKSITSVKFSRDGNLVASAGANKKVIISNKTGEIVHTIESLAGINECSWIAENLMALASDDGTVKIYDLVKSKALASYKIAKGYPYSMDINMNNNTIIAGDTDGFASIFHASCKDFVNRFLVHSSTVTSIHYNHSFDEITTSSYDGTCRQWIPVHRPLCLRTIIPNPKVLTPLGWSSYSPNSEYILCSVLDSTHRLYQRYHNVDTSFEPVEIRRYGGHVNSKLTIASQSITIQNKSFIISGSETGKLFAWDANTQEVLSTVSASDGAVLTFDSFLSENECRIATGGSDGKLKVWEVNIGPSTNDLL